VSTLNLFRSCFITVLLVLMSLTVHARIKLVSLPEREDVVIRLENRQATLVEEERVLTLQQGINQVDFSWKGVGIDPDSIRLTHFITPGQGKASQCQLSSLRIGTCLGNCE
jgi:hypothetical protein